MTSLGRAFALAVLPLVVFRHIAVHRRVMLQATNASCERQLCSRCGYRLRALFLLLLSLGGDCARSLRQVAPSRNVFQVPRKCDGGHSNLMNEDLTACLSNCHSYFTGHGQQSVMSMHAHNRGVYSGAICSIALSISFL